MAPPRRTASASLLAAAISLALIQHTAAQDVSPTAGTGANGQGYGLDANGLTLDPQQADRLQRRTVSTLPFQYTGSNARISIGVDDELQLTGEGLGIFGFDGTRATLLEGWLGRHGAGGVKLGYHWLWGGATREDTLGEARDVWVAKVFGAVDRNEFHDRKATLGAGVERNNRFLDLYYEHALSDARRTSSTSDSVTDTVFGQDPDGRGFQQDITTTTLVEQFAVPYEHGVGFRLGRYFEYPMLRLRGGLDYAWGDDLLEDDHARQLGATVSLEKFIEDTGHSLALELGYTRKNGPFDSGRFGNEDEDLRVALQWRYEFGQAHRRTVTDAPDAASERPAPWVERALRNLPQHRRQVDTYAAQRTTVTTAEGEKVYLNRAPVAQNDAFTTPSGTLLSRLDGGASLLGNDTDPDGDPLTTVQLVTGVSNGTLFIASDGGFEYTPNAGFSGTDSFTYTVKDTAGAVSNVATVTITVQPPVGNLPPVAGPAETFDATAGVQITGDVLDAQDTDPNPGDTLHVELVTDVANGTLALNPDGSFTYTADATFVGTDTFTYVVEDQDGARSQEVTVTIAVSAPPSNLPLSVGDALNTGGVSPFIFTFDDLLANDVGVGTNPFIVVNSAVSSGTLLVDVVNREIGFTPLAGFTGDVTFTYRACDDRGCSATSATVTITVPSAGNLAPVAGPAESFDAIAGVQITGDVLDAQDTDPNPGDTLHVELVTDVANGTLVLNPDGTFTYTADATFVGTDTFTYVVEDQDGARSQEVAVTITVSSATNLAPVANNETFNVPVGTTGIIGNLATNDTDPNPGDVVTFAAVVASSSSCLVPFSSRNPLDASGNVIFTVPAVVGTCTITYRSKDSQGALSNIATATINVTAASANQAPVADSDTFATPFQTTLTGVTVFDGDSDPDGDTFTAELVTDVAEGTLTLNADGSFTYVPANSTQGDITFQYRLKDSGGLFSDPATVTITVGNAPPPQNQKPVANSDSFPGIAAGTTGVVGNVVANDTDPDQGDVVSFAAVVSTSAECATVFANQSPLDANGNVVFTSPAVAGTCTVTYQAKDSSGALSDPGTATITVVAPANVAPVAVNDLVVTQGGVTANFNVVANDTDDDGDALTALTVTLPQNGQLLVSPGGQMSYVPNANHPGTDSFTYVAEDGNGGTSNVATVNITVEPNQLPVAIGETFQTPLGVQLTGNVLANGDFDPDVGDTIEAVLVNPPGSGTVTLDPDGSFVYTPTLTVPGQALFAYKVRDNHGALSQNTAFVTINITP